MARTRAVLLVVLCAAPLLVACGGGGDRGVILHWYVAEDTAGAYRQAAERCADASAGRYRIRVEPLPQTSDTQRELLVRRLAARDRTVDIMGLDVIWTAEFAEAGWLRPWTGARAVQVSAGVLAGPLATARYRGRLWAAPFTSNTQLLWYRKSRTPSPAPTWDQVIAQAEALPGGDNEVAVQGGRYEGYTVWVNSLLASAGTELVADPDRPDRARAGLAPGPTREALAVIRRLASSPVADGGLSVATEVETEQAMLSGRAAFSLNYASLYATVRDQQPALLADLGWTRYPQVVPGRRSRPPLGGTNLGVGAYSPHPELALDAAACLRSAPNQQVAATGGGLPPTISALYDDPAVVREFPFAELLRQGIEQAAPRPATPAYSDVSLAVQLVLHPPASVNPDTVVPRLRRTIDDALTSKALL
ncbi:MAG TPA: extracellular solute-binding protein [Mycobacteriales bacterium]